MAGPMTSSRVAAKPLIPDSADLDGIDPGERRNERTDGRDEPVRMRPRGPHERYAMTDRQKKPGMDYFWAAAKISGQPNPRFIEYLRAGWMPARAEDHRESAGLDVKVPARLVELGFVTETKPDDPVEDRGLMLMMRPKQLSERSREEEGRAASDQFTGHMNRLNNTSRRAIGEKTQLSRRVDRPGARQSDMIPDDADLEE